MISLHQSGFTNAVASLGTALTAGHAALIKRYVQEVYLTYDSDEAGTRAALRAVPILREAGISAKVVRMDPYKDPDEFIKNLGAEEYEKRIHAARNGFMFSLEMLEKQYDMNSPEGKTDFSGKCRGDCLNSKMSWSVTTISKLLQQHTGSAGKAWRRWSQRWL